MLSFGMNEWVMLIRVCSCSCPLECRVLVSTMSAGIHTAHAHSIHIMFYSAVYCSILQSYGLVLSMRHYSINGILRVLRPQADPDPSPLTPHYAKKRQSPGRDRSPAPNPREILTTTRPMLSILSSLSPISSRSTPYTVRSTEYEYPKCLLPSIDLSPRT